MPPDVFQHLMEAPGKALPDMLVTVALGNGFIVTAMLWGAFVAELIDRRLRVSALYLTVLAAFSLRNHHSASPDGNMYLPWTLSGAAARIPGQFALSYLLLAGLFLLLSLTSQSREPPGEGAH